MVFRKFHVGKNYLSKPKITFGRLDQLYFTMREVTRIASRINRRMLIFIFVVNALWGFSAIPGFYIEKLIIDKLVSAVGNPDWQSVLVGIGSLILLRMLLEIFRNWGGNVINYLRRTMSMYFDAELEVLMGNKLAELDLSTIESPEFKDRFDKVQRESGRRAWELMMPLSNIPNFLVGFGSSVFVLFFLSPWIAVGVLALSLPQFLIDQKFIKLGYQLRTKLSPLHKKWGWYGYYLIRNRNFMELKILGISDHLTTSMSKLQKKSIGLRADLDKKREKSRLLGYLPLSMLEFVIAIWLVYLVMIERITVGSFELYLRSLRSAQQNLSGLVTSFLEIYENYIYVNDLVWFLNLEPRIKLSSGSINIHDASETSIEFKDVWFRYKEDQQWILKDMNFKITHGEKIAVVGENGSGKSTMIKLLARFYDPGKGSILVNDKNLNEYNVRKWQENIAVLFQEFETYPFSTKSTVGYGDIDRLSNIDEIKEAVSKTQMREYIESLPLKYRNPLHPEFEKGVSPSIGQWQRLGISRMLFRKNSKILILDEPTSNVDPNAEEKIFAELTKITRDRILIFVTQRFSTVKIADRIFVMDKGKIAESGTHVQLMELNGKYAKLFKLQAKAYLNHK